MLVSNFFRSNQKQSRDFAFVFVIVHIALVAAFCAWPVWDTQYINLASSGVAAYNPYTWIWWFVFLFVLFNFVLGILLMAVIVDTKYKPPGDMHFIFALITLILNVIVVVLCTIIYFFFINKNYTGVYPFNDPKWCCYYYFSVPQQCYNTVPCPVLPTLTTPYVFVLYWVFSGVFTVVAILHLGINRLLRWTGVIPKGEGTPSQGRMLGTGLSVVFAALFAYWVAFPLWNTVYVNGYPLFAIPPSPGPYVSFLYTYQWWFLWLMTTNLAPPVLFFLAAIHRQSAVLSSAYFWLTLLVSITSFICLCVFLGVWLFDCNNMLFIPSAGSYCNDYRYCCEHFSSAANVCPNTTPCVGGSITLYPNPDFIQHIIFAAIFMFGTTIKLWIYYRLRKYQTIR